MFNRYCTLLQGAIDLIESGEYMYSCNAIGFVASSLCFTKEGDELRTWIDNALDHDTFSMYIHQKYDIICKQKHRVEFLNWLMQNLHVVKNKDYQSWEQHMSFIKNRAQQNVE